MASQPSSPPTPSTNSTPTKSTTSTTATSINDMSQADFEHLLTEVHSQAKLTAKQDSTDESVLLAKLACYAIRELHAENIYPSTALRAMSILEYADPEKRRSTGGAIKQAKRELREEHRLKREARKAKQQEQEEASTLIDIGDGVGVEKEDVEGMVG